MDAFNEIRHVLWAVMPAILLCIWCLWAVNWRVVWPVLAAGGWVPLVLVVYMSARVWALIDARPLTVAGVTVGNFFWQLIAVAALTGLGLFCGWLQGIQGWEPETVSLEPPEHQDEDDDHSHH